MACIYLLPALAAAQTAAPVQPDAALEGSKAWVVIGGAATTIRGDCTFCELEGFEAEYNHTWSLLADLGVRLSPRMDAGAEVAWVPATTRDGDSFRTTFVLGVAQFRPWESRGFFVKGGMGMAFVRNWLFAGAPLTQKALSVVIGTGWEFRRSERIGFQVFGTQHAAALGDFDLRDETIENVLGNFWSFGGGVVIR
jgi:hypothetical protein